MAINLDKNDDSKSRQQKTMEKLYFDKDETGDVLFIVESEKIRAHKSVLAAISPKYKAQFYGLQPDNGDIIVEDVTAAAFREFVQFFYLGEANLTEENIEDVLNMAKQSIVDDFVEDCISFLMTNVNNPFLVYRLALFYDIKKLIEHCLLYASTNTIKMFESDGFLFNCNRDMLLQILKLDTFNCREIAVFNACIAWAKFTCKSKHMDAENMANVRAELGDIIYGIRYNSMKIEEFVHSHSLHEGLFEPDEMKEIIYMIGGLKNFEPNKFNRQHRNQELEINRIIYEEASERLLTPIAMVEFSCSEGIIFNGFASGFQLPSNQYVLKVNLLTENGAIVYYKPEYTIKSQKETIIRFKNPIEINPRYSVAIELNIPAIELSTQYTLAKTVEFSNYKFNFRPRPEGAPGILLTRLYFNKI